MKPAHFLRTAWLAAMTCAFIAGPVAAFEIPDGWKKSANGYLHVASGVECPSEAHGFRLNAVEKAGHEGGVSTCTYEADGARGMIRIRLASAYSSTARDQEFKLEGDPADVLARHADVLLLQDLPAEPVGGKPAKRTQAAALSGAYLVDCTMDSTKTLPEAPESFLFIATCILLTDGSNQIFLTTEGIYVPETNVSRGDLRRRSDDDGVVERNGGDLVHIQSGANCPDTGELYFLYDVKILPHPAGLGRDILCDYRAINPGGPPLNLYVTSWANGSTIAQVESFMLAYLERTFALPIDRNACRTTPQADGTSVIYGSVTKEGAVYGNLHTLRLGWSVEALLIAPPGELAAYCKEVNDILLKVARSITKPGGFDP